MLFRKSASGDGRRQEVKVAVEIFGEWVTGVVARDPLYDPRGERVRA